MARPCSPRWRAQAVCSTAPRAPNSFFMRFRTRPRTIRLTRSPIFSQVSIEETGPDCVRVLGGRGRTRPALLKVSLGYRGGFIGEGQISYAGPNALRRAELARDVLAERLGSSGIFELRFDFIGLNSI